MRLIVLGSGTSVPHPQRSSSAYWLETGSGSLLLDCGASALLRMAQEELDWANLDAIWASHFHLDHCGGIMPFLFGTKWATQTQARRKPLIIFGPRGIGRLLRAFDEANNYGLLDQPFPVEVREVEAGAAFEVFDGLRAQTFSTPHTDESLAVRLTHAGSASLVYTSDTGYSDELADFATRAGLFLMECSFVRDKPVRSHLELADAMRLAERAAPRRALLTHLYPEWDEVDLVSEAKKLWSGETIMARDGLRLNVGDHAGDQ